MIFTDLSDQGMVQILDQVNGRTNSDQQTIEKDWWVTQVLRVLFFRPYASGVPVLEYVCGDTAFAVT